MIHTSGALQARLIWVCLLDLAVYVARPVEFVCCDHLDVPKSPIWEEQPKSLNSSSLFSGKYFSRAQRRSERGNTLKARVREGLSTADRKRSLVQNVPNCSTGCGRPYQACRRGDGHCTVAGDGTRKQRTPVFDLDFDASCANMSRLVSEHRRPVPTGIPDISKFSVGQKKLNQVVHCRIHLEATNTQAQATSSFPMERENNLESSRM